MSDGTVRDIEPGDWWVFDDMSTNYPFCFIDPEACPLIGRQGLYGFDICQEWLGAELIGTSRDSYTAAIILRFLRRLMEALGKPRRGVVFERSVWQANAIAGHEVTTSGRVLECRWERPAMDEEQKGELDDGIKSLGLIVHYTYTPRGKEIEGAFNYLQNVFPTFAPVGAVNMGRHAGEYEFAAKQVRRAKNGNFDLTELGFIPMDAHADLTEKVMAWINEKKKFSGGSPETTGESPVPPLARLTERDQAVFFGSRHDVEILNGQVSVSKDGQRADFVHPEIFARLGNGYRVTVKWDPTEPTRGAAIYNRETSSINHGGYQLGQLICFAEYKPVIPRFDSVPASLRDESDPTVVAGNQKKRYQGAVRTAFRAVGFPRHAAATARDGKGNVGEKGMVNSEVRIVKAEAEERTARRAVPTMNRDLLARQAELAREMLSQT
jgi:hypothetical protein